MLIFVGTWLTPLISSLCLTTFPAPWALRLGLPSRTPQSTRHPSASSHLLPLGPPKPCSFQCCPTSQWSLLCCVVTYPLLLYLCCHPTPPDAAAPRSPALTPTSWTFPSGDPAAFSSRIPFRLPDPFHLAKDCRISVLELYLLPHPMGAHGWAILPTRHLSSPSLQRCPSPRPLVQTKSTHRRQASCWGTVPAGFDCIKCAGGADRPTGTKGFQGVGAGGGAEAGLWP